MGISRDVIWAIQGSCGSIQVESFCKDGKYGFEIYSFKRGCYRVLMTSRPEFSCSDDAETAGSKLIMRVSEFDLSKEKGELEFISSQR